jgi:protein SCO1/2
LTGGVRKPLLGIVLAIASVAACGRREPPTALQGGNRPDFGGDFTLTNQDNQPFRLQDVRGRPALLFFGYTSCPDMCPMTMSRINAALKDVGSRSHEVATLFVSVDPARDTPQVLKAYVGSFSTPVIALTGAEADVARVASAYHASYQTISTGTPNYLVNHTSAIFLIDRKGRLRQYFKYDEKPATLAAALDAVLDEKP